MTKFLIRSYNFLSYDRQINCDELIWSQLSASNISSSFSAMSLRDAVSYVFLHSNLPFLLLLKSCCSSAKTISLKNTWMMAKEKNYKMVKDLFGNADLAVSWHLIYHLDSFNQPHHVSIIHISRYTNRFHQMSDGVRWNKVQWLGRLIKFSEWVVTWCKVQWYWNI